MPDTDFTYRLPAVAIGRLAATAEAQTALAALIEVELQDRATSALSPLSHFAPSARLLKKAAAGIAALVLAHTPGMAGDVREETRASLIKLGVPAPTAAGIVDQLAARHVLSTVAQTPRQQKENVTALLAAQKLLDGRL